MLKFTTRNWFLAGFAGCVGLLGMAAYFQLAAGLEPCPLCISQRVAILATGAVFLVAGWHNPGRIGVRRYAVLGALAAYVVPAYLQGMSGYSICRPTKCQSVGQGLPICLSTFRSPTPLNYC